MIGGTVALGLLVLAVVFYTRAFLMLPGSLPCFGSFCANAVNNQTRRCFTEACPRAYRPMCGTDGNTYASECVMECLHVPIDIKGRCEDRPNCSCPLIFHPPRYVCGSDHNTYLTHCHLFCAGVTVLHSGPCNTSCRQACETQPRKFVCGLDGQTYTNECQLNCSEVGKLWDEPCYPEWCQRWCYHQHNYSRHLFVCGSDNITYSSDCALECKPNVTKRKNGVCDVGRCMHDCVVSRGYHPVCGDDHRDYTNDCALRCNFGVKKVKDGLCGKCVCPVPYKPVCGKDGRTYNSECQARCRGVDKKHDGWCVSCINQCRHHCQEDYVCGKDGKIYPNKCVLDCEKVKLHKMGLCRGNGTRRRHGRNRTGSHGSERRGSWGWGRRFRSRTARGPSTRLHRFNRFHRRSRPHRVGTRGRRFRSRR